MKIRFSGVSELTQMFQLTTVAALSAENETRLADLAEFTGEPTHLGSDDPFRRADAHRQFAMFHKGQVYMGLQTLWRDPQLADLAEHMAEAVTTPFRVDETVGDSRAEGTQSQPSMVMSVRDLLVNPARLFSQLRPEGAKEAFVGLMAQLVRGMSEAKQGQTKVGGETTVLPLPAVNHRRGIPWVKRIVGQLFPPPDPIVSQYFLA